MPLIFVINFICCWCVFFKGLLYSGRLRVSDYRSRDEAFVTPCLATDTYSFDSDVKGDIFIPGSAHRYSDHQVSPCCTKGPHENRLLL